MFASSSPKNPPFSVHRQIFLYNKSIRCNIHCNLFSSLIFFFSCNLFNFTEILCVFYVFFFILQCSSISLDKRISTYFGLKIYNFASNVVSNQHTLLFFSIFFFPFFVFVGRVSSSAKQDIKNYTVTDLVYILLLALHTHRNNVCRTTMNNTTCIDGSDVNGRTRWI